MTRRWRSALLLSALLLLIWSVRCTFFPPPVTNLRVIEATPIMHRFPSTDWRPANDEKGQAMVVLHKPVEQAWRISLTGDSKWIDTTKRHELYSSARAVLCDQREWGMWLDGPRVGGKLLFNDGADWPDIAVAVRPAASIAVYDLYIKSHGLMSAGEHLEQKRRYNLRLQRLALCIRLEGGAMYGAHAASREVRVTVGGR